MRQGLIAIGEITCDECGRAIRHPERYLAIDEEGKTSRYCVECCFKMGYARYKEEKGERVITFFPESAHE